MIAFVFSTVKNNKGSFNAIATLSSGLCPQAIDHRSSILQPANYLFTATVTFNVLQRKSPEVLLVINVGNGGHPWTYYELCVVFEEIYLDSARIK